MEYHDLLRDVLSDAKLRDFIVRNLHESMTSLGFSQLLISEFLENITKLDLPVFIERHKDELRKIELEHFFGELVPEYFSEYIVSEVPNGGKVLDLGCGLGTLIKLLINRGTNSEIVGIDIKQNPEWENLKKEGARFEVVQENDFLSFVAKEKPGIVTITWVLHHMEYDQQKRYLQSLHEVLNAGATLIILEDAYSQILPPELGQNQYEDFMKLNPVERHKVVGVNDWIANRVFSMRTAMPVPFAYRTLEDWNEILKEAGFTVTKSRFLGFPDRRDVFNPQSVLVARK
ncbi:MAG: methyltransferase domain-containing protein [Patescibacteria group bacterium]